MTHILSSFVAAPWATFNIDVYDVGAQIMHTISIYIQFNNNISKNIQQLKLKIRDYNILELEYSLMNNYNICDKLKGR